MAVTFDDVRHIAALARLGIPDDRLPVLAKELSGILGHMDVLQSVNVDSGSTPDAAGMPLRAALRLSFAAITDNNSGTNCAAIGSSSNQPDLQRLPGLGPSLRLPFVRRHEVGIEGGCGNI